MGASWSPIKSQDRYRVRRVKEKKRRKKREEKRGGTVKGRRTITPPSPQPLYWPLEEFPDPPWRVVRTGFGASYPLPPRGESFPDASYKGRDGYDGDPGAMPGEVAGCQPHPLSLTLAVPSCKVPSPDPVVSHMPRVDTLEAGANLGRLG